MRIRPLIVLLLFAVPVAGLTGYLAQAAEDQQDDSVLRHVVLFQFKEGTTEETIAGIEAAFAALPGKIPTITGFEWGTDVSDGAKSHGFTHCFIVTFQDQAGLDFYGPHEAHEAFKALIGPHLEQVLVIDYVPGE